MKKRYLALLLIFLTANAFGQSNFYRLSLGAGAGGTIPFSDISKPSFSLGFVGNLDYHFTPFITAGLEVQKGTLKAGTDDYDRAFSNSYLAFNANVKVRAGEFTDFYYSDFLNYTKGFYLGTGFGMIKNTVDNVKQQSQTGYFFKLADDKPNFLVPLNVGIDFYFPDGWGDIRYIVNINYQANITFGEGLDGYDDRKGPRKDLGSAPDIYNFLSVGFKYTFGPKGLSSKTIR